MKNLATTSIVQLMEKYETRWNTNSMAMEAKNGFFLPNRSDNCPDTILPTHIPAICSDVIVAVTQDRPHTRLN